MSFFKKKKQKVAPKAKPNADPNKICANCENWGVLNGGETGHCRLVSSQMNLVSPLTLGGTTLPKITGKNDSCASWQEKNN